MMTVSAILRLRDNSSDLTRRGPYHRSGCRSIQRHNYVDLAPVAGRRQRSVRYVTRDSVDERNIDSRVLLQRFYWSRMM